MRIAAIVAALLCLASPTLACKELAKYPEHLWGSTNAWWESYRVVEIVEARDNDFVVTVKQHFGNKVDVGKRTTLQFIANEQAYALCPISLEVGQTYLIRSTSTGEPLLIQRFNHMNMPSTHPKYESYLQDLEKAEVRPMYVEANTVTLDAQSNRLITQGKVELHYNGVHLFAEQIIDDRSVNQLVAEGNVVLVNPDSSITRSDRMRLPDDYRDTFRSISVKQRATPWR